MGRVVNQPRLSLLGVLVIGAVLCVVLAGLGSFLTSVYAANNTVHEIRGTVESIGAGDVPPVIVVKGQHGSSEGIVVGAVVQQGAVILRGVRADGAGRRRLRVFSSAVWSSRAMFDNIAISFGASPTSFLMVRSTTHEPWCHRPLPITEPAVHAAAAV